MAGLEPGALPGVLSTILQGVGVTLTDINDIVFRLSFFQREYNFFTQRQLTSEIVSHYAGQAVKQAYVLILGLDVIGNPYGLVVGLTKGVEDLFYEPFQVRLKISFLIISSKNFVVRELFKDQENSPKVWCWVLNHCSAIQLAVQLELFPSLSLHEAFVALKVFKIKFFYRITGAMGKGLAALTFDKEYQKKRREQLNKKPANLQEGLARSGKGLVMVS